MVARAILKSLRLAPSTARPRGTPRPSVNTLRLVPIFPRSVGFLNTFFPPKGRFHHGPVYRESFPVNPLQGIIGHQALLPEGHKDVRLRPRLETPMGGTVRAHPSGVEGAPLAA